MTADEMFRELGYEKEDCYKRWLTYKDKISDTRITYDSELQIFSCTMREREFGFTNEEILACAQLIKEMEEQK